MNPPTDRQSRIIELLTGRSRPLAIPEVAERLGCSERTVQRDIEALRRASVEIATESGRAGGLLLNQPVAATTRHTRPAEQGSPSQPAPAPAPL
ncbi:MAG: HTH domain-containing protein, partial [Chloroflexi bacterium]|nr:HTH domain-containing protein [Chloroflexota bacterium]